MKKIIEEKKQLVEMIRGGKVYQRYENAREAIHAYPEKKVQVDEFRSASYLMTVDHNEDAEAIRLLLEKRNELQADPIIAEFLNAELDLCRMLQRICMDILNIADLELEPLADSIRI